MIYDFRYLIYVRNMLKSQVSACLTFSKKFIVRIINLYLDFFFIRMKIMNCKTEHEILFNRNIYINRNSIRNFNISKKFVLPLQIKPKMLNIIKCTWF